MSVLLLGVNLTGSPFTPRLLSRFPVITGRSVRTLGAGTDLIEPYGIALSQDEVFVDERADRVTVYSQQDGKLLRQFGKEGKGPGELVEPGHAALAGDELYVADSSNHRVQVFDARSGAFRREWLSKPYPVGIAISGGEIYVGCRGVIVVYDRQGQLLRQWSVRCDASGCMKDSGHVYVCSGSRVVIFDKAGNLVRQWGQEGTGDGELRDVLGVTVIGEDVYLADFVQRQIKIFDKMGHFKRKWSLNGKPRGMAVSERGELFVALAKPCVVQAFS